MVRFSWVGIVLLAAISTAQAETGIVMQLPQQHLLAGPTQNRPPRSGLTLRIDTRWVDGRAYRPVSVTVSTSNGSPTPRDRVLWIEVSGKDFSSGQPRWVGKTIELPQNERTVTETILVPQESFWHHFRVRTFEGGSTIRELSGDDYNHVSSEWTEANPAILILDRHVPSRDDRAAWVTEQVQRRKSQDENAKAPVVPDLRVLYNEFEFPTWSHSKNRLQGIDSPEEMVNYLRNCPRLDVLPTSECPEHWLALSGVDLIFIQHEHLQDLKQSHSTRFAALEDWTVAGGTLIVWHPERPDIPSSEVLKLFRTQPTTPANANSPHAHRFHGMTFSRLRDSYGYGSNSRYEPVVVDKEGRLHQNTSTLPPEDLPETTGIDTTFPLGFGLVAVIPGNPFPGTPASWEKFAESIGPDRWVSYQRIGISRNRMNPGFWTFLVPGVGMAPVTSYLVLITLFVIVIGPFNYFALRTMKRLNWLVFTVPAGAALVTTALTIYAVFADGFSTQARMRSVTVLNQIDGRGASWSLQSYYAGMAPSTGLRYPTDTAVHLREYIPREEAGGRTLHWRNHQWLKQGYFRSRVPCQFMTIRPYQTERRLEIEEREGGGLRVTNHLGTDLQMGIIIDSQGTPFQVERLAVGESRQIAAGDPVDSAEFRRLMTEADMQPPVGFDQQAMRDSTRRSSSYYYGYSRQQLPEPAIETSAMQRELSRGVNSVLYERHPRSYLALVGHFPEVPWGIEGVTAGEASLDVIHGEW